MFEEYLITHCSPTLASLKPASLFLYRFSSGEELYESVAVWDAQFQKKGIRITWKKVSGANGYYIYRSTKKKSGYKKIHVVKKGKTQSYLDKKARKGKTYYYKIRTYKKAGGKKMQSNWSKVVRKKYKNS
jgi:fibronectin type 3 domain-containing protein